MPINILMPALSPTMEKGNLAKWLKKEGDKVKSGDVIAEIETDKATMEVEAVDEGTLAKIVVPEGTQDVAVNAVIAVLAGEGEDVKAAGAAAASKPRSESGRSAGAKARGCAGCCRRRRPRRLRRPSSPRRRVAPRCIARAAGQRRRPRLLLAAGAAARQGSRDRAVRASWGSGPHGRIVARDVEEAKSGRA